MTQHFRAKNHCECCGERVVRKDEGARVTIGDHTRVWCMDCWDYNDVAIIQYNSQTTTKAIG